jgi:hypothetical protein
VANADKTEVRVELHINDLAVLDGFCNATGKNRTCVISDLLADWAKLKLHESTVICRVAGINPMAPEYDRRVVGKGQ